MKELFIKCPSCGVVLGVKNSKNEAVKKIACPQCKCHLAVSFEENSRQPSSAQPLGALYYGEMRIPLQEGANNTQFPGSQCVALNVVRLADGGNKCIVQPLVADGSVKINGEVLQKGDEVVLVKGDKLDIGHVRLCYDKPCSLNLPVDNPKPEPNPEPRPAPTPSEKSNSWLYILVCMIAFALVTFFLWPNHQEKPQSKPAADTTHINETKTNTESNKDTGKKQDSKKIVSTVPVKVTESPKQEKSQYDLEQAALHGDADAQLLLGRQLVRRHESHQVILGLNYLHQSARKGNGEAAQLWQQTVHSLQLKASANDSAAYYILTKIDQ